MASAVLYNNTPTTLTTAQQQARRGVVSGPTFRGWLASTSLHPDTDTTLHSISHPENLTRVSICPFVTWLYKFSYNLKSNIYRGLILWYVTSLQWKGSTAILVNILLMLVRWPPAHWARATNVQTPVRSSIIECRGQWFMVFIKMFFISSYTNNVQNLLLEKTPFFVDLLHSFSIKPSIFPDIKLWQTNNKQAL